MELCPIMWQSGWEGSLGENGYMYMHDWVPSLYRGEMVGWHHQLNGHEFEQAPGVGNGQGSLACCRKWGREELDTTEQLNWTELHYSPETITTLFVNRLYPIQNKKVFKKKKEGKWYKQEIEEILKTKEHMMIHWKSQ